MESLFEDEEEWRPVVGFEGLYEVSDFGRVRSLDRMVANTSRRKKAFNFPRKGRLLNPSTRPDGYKGFTVHDLVARAFLGVRPARAIINHIDGNRANNRLDNLEYTTYRANSLHAVDTLRKIAGENHPNARLTAASVREICVLIRDG